jgi:hypothetical protein
MRKINPLDVKTSFASLIAEVDDFYKTVDRLVTAKKDKSLLVEGTFLSCAVLWEGFLSDLFIAYINRDSTEFANHLKRSLEGQLKRKAEVNL